MFGGSVTRAAERLAGVAHVTSVHTSRLLDERVGAEVFLKCENFQRTGSFKFRGAYNRVATLLEQGDLRGVIAASSGNHAQALALAGRIGGVPVTVLMPEDAPPAKREAAAAYGASVETYNRYRDDREQLVAARAAALGYTIVPSSGDPDVIAGQATATAEILDWLERRGNPAPATIVVPVAGAGLLSGALLATDRLDPSPRIVGVEPESSPDLRESLAAGRIVDVTVGKTICDALNLSQPSALAFDICRARLTANDIVLVSDEDVEVATRFLVTRLKLVVEPSGAAGVAALLAGKVADVAGPGVVILSGGNVGPGTLARILAG